MKFYIATALNNANQHNDVRDRLIAEGHEITYDWTDHGPVYVLGTDIIREVARSEHRGVALADLVIALWPGGRGTHVEIGMALAMRKPVFFMSENPDHHCASKDTCAFYHHPYVIKSRSLDELYNQLHWCGLRETETKNETEP